MDLVTVGYYDGRAKAAVWVDKGDLRSVFGERRPKLRAEFMEGFIVLTDPRDQQWRFRD